MKKFKCLLILSMLFSLFYKPITSSANEVLDRGVKEIESYGKFNYFRGVTADEYENGEPLSIFYSYFDGAIESGKLEHSVSVENTKHTQYRFDFDYEYEDYCLTSAKVYFDNVLIYHALFDGEFISEVKVCEKLIVEEKTKIKNDYLIIKSYGLITGLEDYDYDEESMEEIGLFLIQGHQFIYNPGYVGKDVYFVTSLDNLISFEDIKSKLSASDQTDGNLTNKIEIYNNTYNPNDENIKIGNYSFDAVVSDNSGNLIYQTCYVRVADLQPPVITVSDPMEVSYTLCYPWSTFLKKFTTSDNVEVAKVEVTGDTYTANYDKPGTYYITATATDTSGNTASATLTVNVVDKVPPKIEGPYEITTTTLSSVTKEQLRGYFTFSDVIDPNVTEYKITDTDGYFDNTKVSGRYNFKISAYDKYGNEANKSFLLIVKDLDYPSITIDSQYTITVDSGVQLTKEQIIEFLNSSGTLTVNVVDVESECFDEENPDGVYDASIILEDGTVITNKLVIAKDVSYAPPVIEEVDYTVGIICAVLGIILLGSVIYFRRVNRLQRRR